MKAFLYGDGHPVDECDNEPSFTVETVFLVPDEWGHHSDYAAHVARIKQTRPAGIMFRKSSGVINGRSYPKVNRLWYDTLVARFDIIPFETNET